MKGGSFAMVIISAVTSPHRPPATASRADDAEPDSDRFM